MTAEAALIVAAPYASCTLPPMLTPAQRQKLLDAKRAIDEAEARHRREQAERRRRLAEVIVEVYDDPKTDTTHQEIADEIGYDRVRVTQLYGTLRPRE